MSQDGELTPQALRAALGRFTTGVTIVSCVDANGAPVGLTANSFNALSLEPPLVLWSLRRASPSVGAFVQATHFAINVLAESQVDLSRRFASQVPDKFADGLAEIDITAVSGEEKVLGRARAVVRVR